MVNQQVAQQLKQLIAQYGAGLADEPRRTGALLRDLCAPHKREVRVLTAVAEEGLAKELVRDGGKTSATILLPRMAKQLHDELAIDENMALWAVTAWAEALGWTVSELNMAAANESASPQPQSSPPHKPSAHHVRETHPRIGQTDRYLDNGDGTVTDMETGMMWMRPCVGQRWENGQVRGKAAVMTWGKAMQQKGDGFAGYRDWRLPSIDELKTLVYCSTGKREYFDKNGFGGTCLGDFQQPTIDLQAFPNTPKYGFWSSSPYAYVANLAWLVYFNYGYVDWYFKFNYHQVRLVRAGQ